MTTEGLTPMSRGWINLVRHDVKMATDECIRTRRLNKDYSVLWWTGRAHNMPLRLVHGSRKC